MDDQSPDPITSLLHAYEKALNRLKRQRTLTENAPATFGELASRVEAEIERRIGVERRAGRRGSGRGTTERRGRQRSNEPATPRPFSGAHLENRD